jgi:hypothetical protein
VLHLGEQSVYRSPTWRGRAEGSHSTDERAIGEMVSQLFDLALFFEASVDMCSFYVLISVDATPVSGLEQK